MFHVSAPRSKSNILWVTRSKQYDAFCARKISNEKNMSIRYVSFNVNGLKTVFNYSPWNQLPNPDLNSLFEQLKADVITLQELKLTPLNLSSIDPYIGHLKNYRSFISLPRIKKGYSGVGLFIRIPQESEPVAVRKHLSILRAEQGITGFLTENGVPYRDMDDNIGGYPDMDSSSGLLLDGEGRAVVVELACNLVVFALYCPANSMGTSDGESFRIAFLKALLQRCRNLTKQGKEVMIIGDINVSLDLIDHADTINELQKKGVVSASSVRSGSHFEECNYDYCVAFKTSTPARALLNSYVWRSLHEKIRSEPTTTLADEIFPKSTQFPADHFLYDTTRYWQGRKMKMYTVWNTLTNSRAINYGSRIDLCLISCPKLLGCISEADILPSILGSDHCPIVTEFTLPKEDDNYIPPNSKLFFEAKHYFKLTRPRDISSLFQIIKSRKTQQKQDTEEQQVAKNVTNDKSHTTREKPTLVYTSRKRHKKQIGSYFSKQ